MGVVVPLIAAAAAAGVNAATTGARNRKQFEYTHDLMGTQADLNKSLALFNQKLNLDTWEKTGPTGQAEQLRKAGLNPALIYGMGGAGGQTVGNAGAGSVSGQSADVQAPDMGMGMQLGAQLAMQKAQVDNLNANTAKTIAETPGAGQTQSRIGADIENTQANTALTNVNTKIAELDRQFKDGTLEQNIANVSNQASQIMAEARSAMTKANIDAATQETMIQSKQLELIGIGIENALKQSNIAVNEQEIKASAAKVLQGWKALDQGDWNIAINKFKEEFKANHPGTGEVTGELIENFLHGIFKDMHGYDKPQTHTINK